MLFSSGCLRPLLFFWCNFSILDIAVIMNLIVGRGGKERKVVREELHFYRFYFSPFPDYISVFREKISRSFFVKGFFALRWGGSRSFLLEIFLNFCPSIESNFEKEDKKCNFKDLRIYPKTKDGKKFSFYSKSTLPKFSIYHSPFAFFGIDLSLSILAIFLYLGRISGKSFVYQ